jgi:Cu+-exporting ATPase
MAVDPHTAKHRADYRGHAYYFCSPGCRTKFIAEPQKFLGARAPDPVAEGTIYTCPMHPEIRQAGPGSCPICGMALEPEIPGAETGPNPELIDMTRRFWVGLVLTLPVFTLEMGAHVFGAHNWVEPALSNYVQFAFATPVVLWAGWPFFVRGWQSLVTRNLNMFTLIAMGTGVAYVYSLFATFTRRHPGELLRICQRHHGTGPHGSGAGASRARSNIRRDPCLARSCTQDCAPCER